MRVFKNLPHKLELAVIDTNGSYVPGLDIAYELIKCSDDSVIDSGSMGEIDSIYTREYTFTELGEYRVKYMTPAGYENGFETIIVDDYANYGGGGGGGLTPEEHRDLLEIYAMYGLDPTKPLIVTPTMRQAGPTIVQSITTSKAKEVKVQRE